MSDMLPQMQIARHLALREYAYARCYREPRPIVESMMRSRIDDLDRAVLMEARHAMNEGTQR